LSGLQGEDTQQMQGVGMAGLVLENLAIEGLGLVQPAGLMVLPGEGQGLGDGELRHGRSGFKDAPRIVSQSAAGYAVAHHRRHIWR
jgi:hypothetical protein